MGLEPTTSCLHGQRHSTTCAKGEPEVVGRGSGSYPCGRALLVLLSGRERISTDGRVRKYSNRYDIIQIKDPDGSWLDYTDIVLLYNDKNTHSKIALKSL